MNILYIGMDNTNYGSRSHEVRVAEFMANLGHNVILCCERMPNFEDEQVPEKLDIHVLPINKGLRREDCGLLKGIIVSIQRYSKFKELVSDIQNRFKIDVIFGSSISSVDITTKLGNDFDIPIVTQVLDVPIWKLEPFSIRNSNYRVWKYWFKFLMKSDHIIVNNDATKTDLKSFATKLNLVKDIPHISVVHYGINTAPFDLVPDQNEDNQIIFVSRLVPYKGVDLLIESLALVKNPPKLIIVGDGPERDALEKLAKENNINCIFLGAISDKDKIINIKRSRFIVYTSTTEHIAGLSPIEAMYCEKPCICFDIKILKDLYKDTVEYVPKGDIKALSEKIDLLNNDENYRKQRGVSGKTFVKSSLTSDNHANAILKILDWCKKFK